MGFGTRARLIWAATHVALMASACTQNASLVVNLRSDFEPQVEAAIVRTRITTADGELLGRSESTAQADWDLLEGARVGDFQLSTLGSVRISVSVLNEDERELGTVSVLGELTSSGLAATVIVTRSCTGVACDVDNEVCLSGSCVDARCTAETTSFCAGLDCEVDADCEPSTSIDCLQGLCRDGLCYQRPSDAYCAPGSCDIEQGCIGRTRWWRPQLAHRQQIRFRNEEGNEALSGLVVPVRVGAAIAGRTAADGSDLYFVDADGVTELPREIETWTETESGLVWVRVPTIDANRGDDHIWMYFGAEPGLAAPPTTGVWDEGYVGVYHLGQSLEDASGRGAHGNDPGDTTNVVPRPLGDARGFSAASSSEVRLPENIRFDEATASAWAFFSDVSPTQAVLSREHEGGNSDIWLGVREGGYRAVFHTENEGRVLTTGGVSPANEWVHVALVLGPEGGTVYANGSMVDELPASSPLFNSRRDLVLGFDEDGGSDRTDELTGRIDEVHLERIGRSTAWVLAEHQAHTGDLLEYGPIEERP